MRQVNEAELIWNLRFALRQVGAACRNDFKSPERAKQDSAEHRIASRVAEQLRRYEILSEAPVPEGTDLFSRAAYSLADHAGGEG